MWTQQHGPAGSGLWSLSSLCRGTFTGSLCGSGGRLLHQPGSQGPGGRGSSLHFPDDQGMALMGDPEERRVRTHSGGGDPWEVTALLEPSGLARAQQLFMS